LIKLSLKKGVGAIERRYFKFQKLPSYFYGVNGVIGKESRDLGGQKRINSELTLWPKVTSKASKKYSMGLKILLRGKTWQDGFDGLILKRIRILKAMGSIKSVWLIQRDFPSKSQDFLITTKMEFSK